MGSCASSSVASSHFHNNNTRLREKSRSNLNLGYSAVTTTDYGFIDANLRSSKTDLIAGERLTTFLSSPTTSCTLDI